VAIIFSVRLTVNRINGTSSLFYAIQFLVQFPNIDLAGAQFVALLKINMHMSLMLNQPTSVSHRKLEEVARASIHLFLHGALKNSSQVRLPKK